MNVVIYRLYLIKAYIKKYIVTTIFFLILILAPGKKCAYSLPGYNGDAVVWGVNDHITQLLSTVPNSWFVNHCPLPPPS